MSDTGLTLLLACGTAAPEHLLADAYIGERLRVLDVYELERTSLTEFGGLLIPMHIDQRYLAANQPTLREFLAAGRTLVFCGQLTYPVFPEVDVFIPLAARSPEEYRVHRVSEHPVFAGVEVDDLTLRKGVAGFYGRGHMPPPPAARIIHRLGTPTGPAVDYVYEPSYGGRVLIHAGNDLWNYAPERESSAHRIAGQLLDWIDAAPSGRDAESAR